MKQDFSMYNKHCFESKHSMFLPKTYYVLQRGRHAPQDLLTYCYYFSYLFMEKTGSIRGHFRAKGHIRPSTENFFCYVLVYLLYSTNYKIFISLYKIRLFTIRLLSSPQASAFIVNINKIIWHIPQVRLHIFGRWTCPVCPGGRP